MLTPQIFASAEQMHHAAAEHWVTCCRAAIATHGGFHIALSGGSTPKALFKLMASDEYRQRIAWDKIHFYFGDERFVPHDHDDSNYKMARNFLLDHVPCDPDKVHPVNTALESAEAAAREYENVLRQTVPQANNGNIQFDLVLLGLGPDGHTASLFPDTGALHETEKLCTAVYVAKFDSWRVTITFPVINSAKNILLLSEGEGKAEILYDLVVKYKNERHYPVQYIQPQGKMLWFIDNAAAKLLT